MTQSNQGVDPTKNAFATFPPIIPMVVIAVALITMAQFGSTEKLAAAFAWLIFVAVLLADGVPAFDKISGRVNTTATTTSTPIVNPSTGFTTGTS